MRRFLAVLILAGLLSATGCQTGPTGGMAPGTQVAQVFSKEIRKPVHYRYWLYLPKDYAGGEKRWPMMLYLHGAGERGDDLQLLKKNGPPMLIEQGKDFPFIVVSPQCPKDQWWELDELNALLDEVIARYAVDENRVYLTGLSMGGYGTWMLACRYPERFAAIAPICGGGIAYLAKKKLAHTPVWAFHGAKDTTVVMDESLRMVEAVQKAGGRATLTIYPDAGHDAWTETYENPKLYEWFLRHRRE